MVVRKRNISELLVLLLYFIRQIKLKDNKIVQHRVKYVYDHKNAIKCLNLQ